MCTLYTNNCDLIQRHYYYYSACKNILHIRWHEIRISSFSPVIICYSVYVLQLCSCLYVQVSRQAFKLLTQIEHEPLLNLDALNPDLFDHTDIMANVQTLRQKLRFLGDYIRICRSGISKKIQPRCVCVLICMCLEFGHHQVFNRCLRQISNNSNSDLFPDFSRGHIYWITVMYTVYWTCSRYLLLFIVVYNLN